MKKLELELKKKLLILQGEFMAYYNGRPLKFICKGDEFTEEVAKGLVEQIYHPSITFYKDYNSRNPEDVGFACEIRSFTSAIEAKGFTFGKNPYTQKPADNCDNYEVWDEYEKTNFNPEKTLIFEIIS